MRELIDIRVPAGTTIPDGFGSQPQTREVDGREFVVAPGLHESRPRTDRSVPLTDLYSGASGRGRLILKARSILDGAVVRLRRAQQLQSEDRVATDYEVTLVQGDLPELFCCSSLSEGFAALTVGLHHALRNRKGEAITAEQLSEVTGAVARMAKEPFVNYEHALDVLDRLEDVGLNVNPPINQAIAEVFDEESGG